ncbi:MAG: penicillin acylase family protein [Nitrococcus mobilis]|nr:penicillin acylase family protein [Nitrococcus mobilis]
MTYHRVALSLLLVATALTAGTENSPGAQNTTEPRISAHYDVDVRRTSYGIPHIKAHDWGSLGYGYGYAQAEDNLCTLADGFVSFRGRRSYFFGPDHTPPVNSTFGRPKNIDVDFFFRSIAPDELVRQYKAHQPPELQNLVKGFAAGYSRYVREINSGGTPTVHRACRSEPWVSEITEADVYRRMYAINIAGGYAQFLPHIVNAQPPDRNGNTVAKSDQRLSAASMKTLARRVSSAHFQAGGQVGIGSNAIAFGGQATDTPHGLLFGNPHWYWGGPDRFYQAHLTLPGEIDVSGASLLGLPFIVIGYNNHIAWSHTVSTARRFGLFELTLVPGTPTSYRYDGEIRKMTPLPITIEARRSDGRVEKVTRTLYRTHFGPVVDLRSYSPAMGWSGTRAFALRDVNADNFRIFRAYLRWGQAHSLDEFISIQQEEASVPWLTTLAVGRNERRAWYADIGAIPNVSDVLAATCTTRPLGAAFTQSASGVPFLDGSRSACEWPTERDSVQPGAMGIAKLPSLIREDYVANMNDSHWLTNPAQPLTGYPSIIGSEKTVQSLRTRLGHLLVQSRLAGTDGYAGDKATSAIIRKVVLDSRVLSAELFKAQLLADICAERHVVTVTRDSVTGEAFSPARVIDLSGACEVLRQWNNTGNTNARGVHIWDEFWARANLIPSSELFATPFSATDPIHTPRDLKPGNAQLSEALGVAVLRVQQSGFALDAPRGEYLFVRRNGTRVSLFGGCGSVGYFTVVCSEHRIEQGGYPIDGDSHGNTYLQVVTFSEDGVEPYTLLTFSQSDDPASRHFGDYTQRYAGKQWLRVPFRESEIRADPAFTAISLHH